MSYVLAFSETRNVLNRKVEIVKWQFFDENKQKRPLCTLATLFDTKAI